MASQRTVALISALGFAALIALGAWFAGSRIESPADAAARTAPPTPSPILVPVEHRALSTNIVTRGTGRFGLPQQISIAPSALKASPGLIATLPARSTQLHEGSVLLTASGRPVFVLQGRVPAYRDLVPGTSGDDVLQLERALLRLGFEPGPVDGTYDAQTAAAATKWYAARKFEPFGPTREQRAAIRSIERDADDANKASMAAAAAAAAALPAVNAARAAAEHSVRTANAEIAARAAELRSLEASREAERTLAPQHERAKSNHANAAAETELAALIAEEAMISLDPRQPETARLAAKAKVELARAAAHKTRLDGDAAVLAAQRAAAQVDVKIELAQAALASARSAAKAAALEGERLVRAAVDAQKLAEFDARLADARAEQFAADLMHARRKLGVQIPLDEIVFVPALPVRVEEVTASIGGSAAGPVLTVTDNQLAIDASLTLETAPLVKPGMAVAIDEQALGLQAKGVVAQVAGTPGTRGVDGYHVYFEVRVTDTSVRLEGVSVRLTIPVESTRGQVLVVPASALSLAADGTSRVQVHVDNALKYVAVRPGLSSGGYVEVTPVQGELAPGQMVVVGYRRADLTAPGAPQAKGAP